MRYQPGAGLHADRDDPGQNLFGPRTQDGVRAWDTFMSLAATARKLGISLYQYIHDRLSQANRIPSLASLIETRAQELALGASWTVA